MSLFDVVTSYSTLFFFPLFVSENNLLFPNRSKKEEFCQVGAEWITAPLTLLAVSSYCNMCLYTRSVFCSFLFTCFFLSLFFSPFFNVKPKKRLVTNEQIECESIWFRLTEQLKSRKPKAIDRNRKQRGSPDFRLSKGKFSFRGKMRKISFVFLTAEDDGWKHRDVTAIETKKKVRWEAFSFITVGQ